ncbi:cytidine deaminase [Breznakia sp. PF5-3]|uniref:cytidine deaminase n=1 Tax=unclassified Breznakia TaxID=2623764 RepID=UPI0024076C13|nr:MULTISPECIES: cytidine deaminase [unclassified Breznakia]MDF9824795.1 cytidine deaminase [Breznakia sp. PM6-1]MDF9835749.1 cytidine deaminase [Breznakia sp. PF5-3]MDF9837835.1 cytidine deaminase [Breznakia sp. PFB2-8]MDF9859794.1 cytidine deaminase [Breznakia sp. PH5-24]
METLTKQDEELLALAKAVIYKNYDGVHYNHTVGAAVRCRNGNMYIGVNVYSLHGACAEMIALGNAITAGERDFECIVAYRGGEDEGVLSPCGNCRQLLSTYMPKGEVILEINGEHKKISVSELLPYAYEVESE